eukprot:TRINITY_DN5598_c0_g1_i1.p1 TRINITY_DN5598_c0_g1~~TRINITY_DN5598_c0_g1_i1.p1  ORF type:complete len:307 (-),score=76.79 TRINITY_DN5598_c0_g1_i1:53-973(-)
MKGTQTHLEAAARRVTRLRHIVQIVVLLLLNGKAFGMPRPNWLTVPVLHSTQSPFSNAQGAFDTFEYTLSHGVVPLLSLGVIFLTAITVGKLLCAWACPMGFVQDVLSYLPFKKAKLSTSTSAQLKELKWAVLAFSVFCCLLSAFKRASVAATLPAAAVTFKTQNPLGVFSDSPFSIISPAETFFTYIPWVAMWESSAIVAAGGVVVWLKVALCGVAVACCLLVPRFFCRFICPLAAMIELVNPYKMLRIAVSPKTGRDELNNLLASVCPMGCQQQSSGRVLDSENCIHCGNCVASSHSLTHQVDF